MPHFLRINFNGDPNIGLYGFATDKYVLTGMNQKKILQRLEKTLHVRPRHSMMLNTEFVGIFCSGNSEGIVVPSILAEYELPNLGKMFGKVLALKTDYSALGNLILMNDNGIMVSPLIKNHAKEIKEFFSLPCESFSIANSRIVGKLGIATNKGCLVHPRASEAEKRKLKDILGVDIDIGTVNFGSPFPGSGIIANSSGCVVSEASSGPEMGRIAETLGFV
ncbi:MAG: translation initiation factor IF-6 [Candidatus Aenigmarchaeota archaeon]|nr:translation initiation factor IF-6 [Candidatus Aenigmarchaeota archaeon]